MRPNTRRSLTIALSLMLLCISGCYHTATKAEVINQVRRQADHTPGSKLVPNGSDENYNYYLIENQDGDVLERYRVPRQSP